MAAGDKSKKLVNEIRDAIGDLENNYYKNDNSVYERLNYYQTLFMTKYFTTFKRWEIDLTAAVYKYPLDDTVLAVVHKPYSNNEFDYKADWINEPYLSADIDPPQVYRRTIILQNEAEIPANSKLFVETFVKAQYPISATKDPEIGDDYLACLKQAVKSEHRERLPDMGFASISQVISFVRSLSNGLKTKKLIPGSSLRNLNF